MPSTYSSRNRQNRAYDLRAAGYTYATIAERTGYSSPQAARQAVLAANARGYRGQNRSTITAPTTAPTRPNSPCGGALATGRTFGIEIEFTGISIAQAVRAINAAGIDCFDSGYTHRVVSQWKVVPDGSCGYEAVSPILFGEDGYEQVRKVMDALSAAGAQVDRNCGMHVHHGADDLNGEQLASLFELYNSHADAIDHLVAPSRRRNNAYYTRRHTAAELAGIVRALRNQRDGVRNGSVEAITTNDGRYRHLNIKSFPKYGTIEIRQHQGSLNGEKAVAWIKFGQALVQAAIDGGASSVPNTVFEMINTLRLSHLLEAEVASYLLSRAMHFSAAE